jgi:threonine synthase
MRELVHHGNKVSLIFQLMRNKEHLGMQFYSTNHKSPKVSFREALLKGQAPDRGLYMPESIPKISAAELAKYHSLSYAELAVQVMKHLLTGEVPEDVLRALATDAYNYSVPLIPLKNHQYVMKLDQGPTASFKDFAARMMARLMQYFLKQENRTLIILTATSGDTGGAVADAFYGLDNISVVVLYPKAEISDRQRRQMTTLGKNVIAIGIDGKFDDCQALVKDAFADPALSALPLSSANSINFGRLLPQSVYYFYAWAQLAGKSGDPTVPIVFSVPSGNFGDLLGGLLAQRMGLPVHKFIAAVNENDEFPRFLATGTYQKIAPSRNCLSSAMNVGHPSNLARLIDLYGGHLDEKGQLHKSPDMDKIRNDIWSVSVSDAQTKETIKEVHQQFKFILEAHGAVGWAGLQAYLKHEPFSGVCVSFETADPAKFPQQIVEIIGVDPLLPPNMQAQTAKQEFITELPNNYDQFKAFLTQKFLK